MTGAGAPGTAVTALGTAARDTRASNSRGRRSSALSSKVAAGVAAAGSASLRGERATGRLLDRISAANTRTPVTPASIRMAIANIERRVMVERSNVVTVPLPVRANQHHGTAVGGSDCERGIGRSVLERLQRIRQPDAKARPDVSQLPDRTGVAGRHEASGDRQLPRGHQEPRHVGQADRPERSIEFRYEDATCHIGAVGVK